MVAPTTNTPTTVSTGVNTINTNVPSTVNRNNNNVPISNNNTLVTSPVSVNNPNTTAANNNNYNLYQNNTMANNNSNNNNAARKVGGPTNNTVTSPPSYNSIYGNNENNNAATGGIPSSPVHPINKATTGMTTINNNLNTKSNVPSTYAPTTSNNNNNTNSMNTTKSNIISPSNSMVSTSNSSLASTNPGSVASSISTGNYPTSTSHHNNHMNTPNSTNPSSSVINSYMSSISPLQSNPATSTVNSKYGINNTTASINNNSLTMNTTSNKGATGLSNTLPSSLPTNNNNYTSSYATNTSIYNSILSSTNGVTTKDPSIIPRPRGGSDVATITTTGGNELKDDNNSEVANIDDRTVGASDIDPDDHDDNSSLADAASQVSTQAQSSLIRKLDRPMNSGGRPLRKSGNVWTGTENSPVHNNHNILDGVPLSPNLLATLNNTLNINTNLANIITANSPPTATNTGSSVIQQPAVTPIATRSNTPTGLETRNTTNTNTHNNQNKDTNSISSYSTNTGTNNNRTTGTNNSNYPLSSYMSSLTNNSNAKHATATNNIYANPTTDVLSYAAMMGLDKMTLDVDNAGGGGIGVTVVSAYPNPSTSTSHPTTNNNNNLSNYLPSTTTNPSNNSLASLNLHTTTNANQHSTYVPSTLANQNIHLRNTNNTTNNDFSNSSYLSNTHNNNNNYTSNTSTSLYGTNSSNTKPKGKVMAAVTSTNTKMDRERKEQEDISPTTIPPSNTNRQGNTNNSTNHVATAIGLAGKAGGYGQLQASMLQQPPTNNTLGSRRANEKPNVNPSTNNNTSIRNTNPLSDITNDRENYDRESKLSDDEAYFQASFNGLLNQGNAPAPAPSTTATNSYADSMSNTYPQRRNNAPSWTSGVTNTNTNPNPTSTSMSNTNTTHFATAAARKPLGGITGGVYRYESDAKEDREEEKEREPIDHREFMSSLTGIGINSSNNQYYRNSNPTSTVTNNTNTSRYGYNIHNTSSNNNNDRDDYSSTGIGGRNTTRNTASAYEATDAVTSLEGTLMGLAARDVKERERNNLRTRGRERERERESKEREISKERDLQATLSVAGYSSNPNHPGNMLMSTGGLQMSYLHTGDDDRDILNTSNRSNTNNNNVLLPAPNAMMLQDDSIYDTLRTELASRARDRERDKEKDRRTREIQSNNTGSNNVNSSVGPGATSNSSNTGNTGPNSTFNRGGLLSREGRGMGGERERDRATLQSRGAMTMGIPLVSDNSNTGGVNDNRANDSNPNNTRTNTTSHGRSGHGVVYHAPQGAIPTGLTGTTVGGLQSSTTGIGRYTSNTTNTTSNSNNSNVAGLSVTSIRREREKLERERGGIASSHGVYADRDRDNNPNNGPSNTNNSSNTRGYGSNYASTNTYRTSNTNAGNNNSNANSLSQTTGSSNVNSNTNERSTISSYRRNESSIPMMNVNPALAMNPLAMPVSGNGSTMGQRWAGVSGLSLRGTGAGAGLR